MVAGEWKWNRMLFVTTLSVALLFSVFAVPSIIPLASAAGVQVVPPIFQNIDGQSVTDLVKGQEVMITATISNDNKIQQAFTYILEIRKVGVTIYIEYSSDVLQPNSDFKIAESWTAERAGLYQARLYVISEWNNPEALSDVKVTSFKVRNSMAQTSESNISRIDRFFVLGEPESNEYQVRFSLIDRNQGEISEDGTVSLTLVDERNAPLYKKTFQVKKSDFGIYQLVLTGEEFLAYVWTIPTSEMEKGIGFGTAKMMFKDNFGNRYTAADDSVIIPEYSEEEIIELYEEEYIKSSIPIDLTIQDDNIELSLTRVGYYKHLEFDTWGDEVINYRIDIEVKNVGNSKITFISTWNSHVVADGNVYKVINRVERELYPDASGSGGVYFETPWEFAEVQKVVISDRYVFDLQSNTGYILEQKYEEDYLKSSQLLNLKIKDADFEVVMQRAGYYIYSSDYGDDSTVYRIDLGVTNNGKATNDFASFSSYLIANGKKYDASYDSSFDGNNIQAGSMRNGSLFFDLPMDAEVEKLVIERSSESTYNFDIQEKVAYTDEQYSEEQYVKNAIPLNLLIMDNDNHLKIKVVRAGYYTYENYYETATTYRVDVAVENTGKATTDLSTYGSIIQVGDNKYDISYYSNFDGDNIFADTTREGYLLFEMPNALENINKIIISGYYVFDLDEKQAYTTTELYEREYIESATEVNKTVTREMFEITLVRVGLYSYESYGDQVTAFRTDFEIKNIGDTSEYVPSDYYLQTEKLEYQSSLYDSSFGNSKPQPGTTVEGYVLFANFDDEEELDMIQVIVEKHWYPQDLQWKYTVDLDN